MSSDLKTGCRAKQRFGYIAVGYNHEDCFWYSSEGVFRSKEEAIKDLRNWYEVDNAYAIRIKLEKSKGKLEK